MHEDVGLLAADQSQLAERSLLVLARSLVLCWTTDLDFVPKFK